MLKSFRVQNAGWLTEGELRTGEEHFRLVDYYDKMKTKYERAAARPWLSVEPDRPPPEWPKDIPNAPPQSNRVQERPPDLCDGFRGSWRSAFVGEFRDF